MKINIINSLTYQVVDRFMMNKDAQESIEYVKLVYPGKRLELTNGMINVFV